MDQKQRHDAQIHEDLKIKEDTIGDVTQRNSTR